MHFGGAMFFTDYSMSAPELARALEERVPFEPVPFFWSEIRAVLRGRAQVGFLQWSANIAGLT